MTTKFIAKIEENGNWYYLAKSAAGEPTLVETIISLYNKGFLFETSPIDVKQMVHSCGYKDYKLIVFDCPTANGRRPFDEIVIINE